MESAFEHPFENDGMACGVCTVCGGVAASHSELRLDGGIVVRMTRRPEDTMETVRVTHYESGDLPAGSVACLEDGRYILTEQALTILRDRAKGT